MRKKPRKPTRPRISATISTALRYRLQASADKSRRPLSTEIEVLLMAALDLPEADDIIVIKTWDGLMAFVRAYAKISLWGPRIDRVALELMRNGIMKDLKSRFWLTRIVPHLPPELREVWMAMPLWKEKVG